MSRGICILVVFAVLLWITPVSAQVTVPGTGDPQTLEEAISELYSWSVRIVGLCAFIMLLYAGVRRIMGDTGGSNQIIQDALIGTVLLLSAVVILNSINPDTTKQDKPVFPAAGKTQ